MNKMEIIVKLRPEPNTLSVQNFFESLKRDVIKPRFCKTIAFVDAVVLRGIDF
jgi:hypothetical protein